MARRNRIIVRPRSGARRKPARGARLHAALGRLVEVLELGDGGVLGRAAAELEARCGPLGAGPLLRLTCDDETPRH